MSNASSSPSSTAKERIAVLALDGFDSLQVSGIVAAVSSVGHVPVLVGTRKGLGYPRGVSEGDKDATGVVETSSTLDSLERFAALFVPDGDEHFVAQLESDAGIKIIRESARNYQTSELLHNSLVALFLALTQTPFELSSVGAVGAAVPVVAHKALPGDTDLKADLSAAFSSKKGFVLASNLVSDEASTWQKIKGVADLGGFGFAFFDAVSKQPHEGELFLSCSPFPTHRRDTQCLLSIHLRPRRIRHQILTCCISLSLIHVQTQS